MVKRNHASGEIANLAANPASFPNCSRGQKGVLPADGAAVEHGKTAFSKRCFGKVCFQLPSRMQTARGAFRNRSVDTLRVSVLPTSARPASEKQPFKDTPP